MSGLWPDNFIAACGRDRSALPGGLLAAFEYTSPLRSGVYSAHPLARMLHLPAATRPRQTHTERDIALTRLIQAVKVAALIACGRDGANFRGITSSVRTGHYSTFRPGRGEQSVGSASRRLICVPPLVLFCPCHGEGENSVA